VATNIHRNKHKPPLPQQFLNGEVHDWYRIVHHYSDHLVAKLKQLLLNRTGLDDPTLLSMNQREAFFRLSMPKALLKVLMEEDWYVDPDRGISLYEIERPRIGGNYKMLHLVMNIKSQNPNRNHRFAGVTPPNILDAYRRVVRTIFERRETAVTDALIDRAALEAHLNLIKARRALFLAGN